MSGESTEAQRAVEMLVSGNTLPRPLAEKVVGQLQENEQQYIQFCLSVWDWEFTERRNELMYRAEGAADILKHLLPLPVVERVRCEAGREVVDEHYSSE